MREEWLFSNFDYRFPAMVFTIFALSSLAACAGFEDGSGGKRHDRFTPHDPVAARSTNRISSIQFASMQATGPAALIVEPGDGGGATGPDQAGRQPFLHLASASPDDGWRLAGSRPIPSQLVQDTGKKSAPSGAVDLGAANKEFNNPLTSATLFIIENDTLLLDGDLSDGTKVTNITVIEPIIPISIGNTGWALVNRPILPIAFSAPIPIAGSGGSGAEGGSINFKDSDGLGDFTSLQEREVKRNKAEPTRLSLVGGLVTKSSTPSPSKSHDADMLHQNGKGFGR